MVVVHEVQHGPEHAIRSLLVIPPELARRHRGGHLIPADGCRVPPQTLVAILSKRRTDLRAQREYLGEIALHDAQRVRCLHGEALRPVLVSDGGAGVERLVRLQVLAVVAAMRAVHDQVLHEDAVDTGILLHGARQSVAIMQRVEQLVRPDGHDRMSQAVNAIEVVEGLSLFSWNGGTDAVEIAQELLAAQGQREALHHPVIVSRAARVVAIRKCVGNIGVLSHRGLSDRVRDRVA